MIAATSRSIKGLIADLGPRQRMTAQSQAILLLTANLGKADSSGAKPLTNGEWGRFAGWLHHKGHAPADLLTADADRILADLSDRTLSVDRVLDCSLEDFISRLAAIPILIDLNSDEIATCLGLQKKTVQNLLKRGVTERLLEKTTKPVRFRVAIRQPTLL